MKDGSCACICTDGFTGPDCTIAGQQGCTTTSFPEFNSADNVTLGDAIPRLLQQAQTNFSISLSATAIMAKFKEGNLSCAAENALVTFDGQPTRNGEASALNVVNDVATETLTVYEGPGSPAVQRRGSSGHPLVQPPLTSRGFSAPISLKAGVSKFAAAFSTTISFLAASTTLPPTVTTTVTTTIRRSATPSATFTVTENALDFARIAVLFILQLESLETAETAQGALQQFFTEASQGSPTGDAGVSIDQARNITLGNGNSVDLVQFLVDTGALLAGGNGTAS
jgi:hypothetical protein